MRGFKAEVLLGVSAIVIGLSLPVFANAAPPEGARHEARANLDTDKDGKVSQSEWDAATEARFIKTDANGDGSISREEATAEREKREAEMRKKRGDAMFKRADTNADGKLSKAEYEAVSQKIYERMMKRKADGAPPSEQE
ncbi:MAG: EF-hand domain-containing protein [Parvibaculum sp.]|nr:EF-hand domain-containing protein [Parvibaculum sp.]